MHLEGFIQRRVNNWRSSGETPYSTWFSILRCLVSCVSKPPSQDHKPGDGAYEEARECARRALQAFAQLLRQPLPTITQPIRNTLNEILYLLRHAAQPVGLISPELVEGMACFLHDYERMCGRAYEWEEQRTWILELERDFLASRQVGAAYIAWAFL